MAFRTTSIRPSLREYDIRGIVGRTLHAGRCVRDRPLLRLASSRAAAARTVAVGYDGRLSSPELEAALVDGLSASGMEVLRIGRGPTPMLYYAATTLRDRRRGHGHRQPQPARLQRLQDDAGRQAVLRRADPATSARMAAAGDVVAEADGSDAQHRRRGRLRRAAGCRTGTAATAR